LPETGPQRVVRNVGHGHWLAPKSRRTAVAGALADNDAIDGVIVGQSSSYGSSAAFRREPVPMSDIANDPLWAGFRE
ncbi:hypothetical protein QCD79_31550, partial [Pseudomonas quasicaspiana]|nr:hypothetical protein [Pseudomonas quasicaspiana]